MASKEHAFPWCPNSTFGTSYGIACSRLAISITLSAGTKRNSAFGSTNFLINQGQATLSTFTFSRVIHFIIQDAVNPNAFSSLVLAVLQIRVMDHLRYLQDGFVLDPKPLHQGLQRAIVSMMRKLHV